MKKPIVIFGAGGFGREVLQLIDDINEGQPTWHCVGFIVDASYDDKSTIHGLSILGDTEWLVSNPDIHVVVAVGSSSARWRITNLIKTKCKNKFATLVHPRAWIGKKVEIGCGSIICAGALITTDIIIGEHVHVNIGSTIGHDTIIYDYVTLNPGVNISGNVVLHKGVEMGTGSIAIPRCKIGEWSTIGAGSVILKSIKDNSVAVGVPSRVIKEMTFNWYK